MSLPPELSEHALVRALQGMHPHAVAAASVFRQQLIIEVPASLLRTACECLRSHPDCPFEFLADLTAVDRYPLEPRFEVVYQLLSLPANQRLCLKARIAGDNPRIDSVSGLWSSANWLEREVFDLFGIHFNGHPNLRRLLMPEDWEGHPLRKDYPVEGYR